MTAHATSTSMSLFDDVGHEELTHAEEIPKVPTKLDICYSYHVSISLVAQKEDQF